MKLRYLLPVTIFLALCLAAAAGCIEPQPPAVPATTAVTMPVTAPALTNPTLPATIPPVTTVPPVSSPAAPVILSPTTTTPIPVTPTLIPKAQGRDTLDDPRIGRMSFEKEWLPFDIPDCAMRAEFAEIAGNPGYGIRQKEPELILLPDATMSTFLRKYAGRYADEPNPVAYITPAEIGGTACSTGLGNPKWNFVMVNTSLVPRNARTAEYDIGLNIRSRGTIIEQIRLNRTFTIDRPVEIAGFIPLKVEETEFFDSIDLVFARRKA